MTLNNLITFGAFWNKVIDDVTFLLEYFLFLNFLNIIFESEIEWEWGGAEREGGTEFKTGSRLWAISTESDAGLKLMSCEIMTWAEVRRFTDWATQVPLNYFFDVYLFIFEREKAQAGKGGERERKRQNPRQAPGSELSAQSPMWGSNSQTVESCMTWAEVKDTLTKPPRRPSNKVFFN